MGCNRVAGSHRVFLFPVFFSTRLGFNPRSIRSQATRQAGPSFKTMIEGAHEL